MLTNTITTAYSLGSVPGADGAVGADEGLCLSYSTMHAGYLGTGPVPQADGAVGGGWRRYGTAWYIALHSAAYSTTSYSAMGSRECCY
eukprot:2515810-Rhodomonas_salina.1